MHVHDNSAGPAAGFRAVGLHCQRLGSSGSQRDAMADRGVPPSLLHAFGATCCGLTWCGKAPWLVWTFCPALTTARQAHALIAVPSRDRAFDLAVLPLLDWVPWLPSDACLCQP